MYDAAALLAGNEGALADAIDALTPELYRYAAGILLSSADAADAVQTAFVRLWRRRADIRDASAVRAYLYRCTLRACIDIQRKRRLFVPVPQSDAPKPMSDALADALRRLSPEERAIVYERAVDDTPYAELAERLGMREATVRKKYERAKKKLAAMLKGDAKHGE
ncbi:MAG: RNA polymerase sigma factor [Clostridia bacterium]|nr:RNA polymerase sigma factor [Clostridia bacterium]